jgi:hypothetical protein
MTATAVLNIPETITVSGPELFETVATLHALVDTIEAIAGGEETPLSSFIYQRVDANGFDEGFGITWDNDLHLTNPTHHELHARANEIKAAMLDSVVADPHELLVSPRGSRAALAERADEARVWAKESHEEAVRYAAGNSA